MHTFTERAKASSKRLNHQNSNISAVSFLGARGRVAGVLRSGGTQAKLKVGPSNDAMEQQADRVADRVVRGEQIKPSIFAGGLTSSPSAGDQQVRLKEVSSQIPATGSSEPNQHSITHGGQPMDSATQGFFESHMGQDFGDVRIHHGARAAEMASSINARAFTLGNHIVMGEGEYNPSSLEGRWLLGHELTHVLQQQPDTIRREPASDVCPEYGDTDWVLSRETPALLTDLGEPGSNEAGWEEQEWILANFPIASGSLNETKVEDPMRFLIDLLTRAHETRAWGDQGYFHRRFHITGYADCIGGEESNMALAQQRAETVQTMLVAQMNEAGIAGDNASRVSIEAVVGEGHEWDQSSPEMRAMSRAVIIREEWVSAPDSVQHEIEEERKREAEKRHQDFLKEMPEEWLNHARSSGNSEYAYWAETVAANWPEYIDSLHNDARVMTTRSGEFHVGTLQSISELCARSPDFCPVTGPGGYLPRSIEYYMSNPTGEQLRRAQQIEAQSLVMVNTDGGESDNVWNSLPFWMRTGIR